MGGKGLDPFPSGIGSEEASDLLSALGAPVDTVLGPFMTLSQGQIGQGAKGEEDESECNQIRHDARDKLNVRDYFSSSTVWAIELGRTVPKHGVDRSRASQPLLAPTVVLFLQ